MFCPRCGQERVSQDTSFCSRCGFLLTGTADLILTDGLPVGGSAVATTGKDSPRWHGIKQGIFMIMLMIVLTPVLGLVFRFAFNMIPWPIGILVFLLGGGGLLRIIYALFFESKNADESQDRTLRRGEFPSGQIHRELPAGDRSDFVSPAAHRAGSWLDTNDLQPHSVIDNTTKLLEKEQE